MDQDDISFDGSELTEGETTVFTNIQSGSRPGQNLRFHATQSVNRDCSAPSLSIGRINKDAVHKLDVNMIAEQDKINDVYQNDAKSVGFSVRPSVGEWNKGAEGASMFDRPRRLGRYVQTGRGMSNFSSIQLGDPRLQRVFSNHREEYRDPADRKVTVRVRVSARARG